MNKINLIGGHHATDYTIIKSIVPVDIYDTPINVIDTSNNKDIFKKGPLKDMLKEMIINQRKGIFGKKTDVLKDSYYEKLGPKTIKKLKKEGATSGCTLMVI